MRVLVTGATGMIGAALVERLLCAGHGVVLAVRDVGAARRRWPGCDAVPIDFSAMPPRDVLAQSLAGIDALVNAVGIFREDGSQRFDHLHVKGPVALFEAAATAGVRRIVQLSALGAGPGAATAYLASKGEADAALQALPVESSIVRPSLVFAPEGASTRWFALLAALPLTPLPGGGGQRIQPVHRDDLVEAIVRLLAHPAPPGVVDAVGPTALSLREYLAALKSGLRTGGVFLPVPMALVAPAARLMSRRRGSLVTPESMQMLEAGNTADVGTFAAVLGRLPRPAQAFIELAQAGAIRSAARLGWTLPLLRYAMAAMWIVTGIVSAFVFPVDESLALLARTGISGAAGPVALYGAAALDVLLGALMLAPRRRRWLYKAQFVLIGFYTVTITLFLPAYWAHPYGPILKNLPLLAAIALLHELDTDD
jgi:uncharacterized protein YbjT (DUF2867 family)